VVLVVAKIILNAFEFMKQTLSQVGFRLRALRRLRHHTQASLASVCQYRGFPVSRSQLARYEIGYADVPARFIPVLAYVLRADITDLLPPLGMRVEPSFKPEAVKGRNLTGQQIRFFRRQRKWTQQKLAEALQKMGLPITRHVIANIETLRTEVTDCQLVCFAAALRVSVHSLFPNSRHSASSADALDDNLQTNRQHPIRHKSEPIPNPYARIVGTIKRFAKRLLPRPGEIVPVDFPLHRASQARTWERRTSRIGNLNMKMFRRPRSKSRVKTRFLN
jgi:transcriptional regulator with XRE-family HTH domain